ncbi:MAG TPA: hypothetical protein VIC70_05840 [Gaiellaceae bacterium]|jgi:hypothetical protein
MELLSRRQVLVRGAAAAGGIAGLGLLEPALALARGGPGNPSPIPGGLDESFTPVPSDPFIHVLSPGLGPQLEMATITDFKGVIGASEIRGTARGSDGSTWDFDTDMRFMQGTYVDRNGQVRKGSFGFV